MYYESEIRILRETFRKCRVQTVIAEIGKSPREKPETVADAFVAGTLSPERSVAAYLPPMQQGILYRLRDPFECTYLALLLPELPRQAALIIGPYLPAHPSGQLFLEWAEANHIPPAQTKNLEDYYSSVPVLADTNHLFALVESFCEWLWGIGAVTLEDVNRDLSAFAPLIKKAVANENRNILWDMQAMEQRYNYENELMEAVARGQIHKADMLLSNFSANPFELRLPDPVRNAKNYCIIMNTLLRKAAEQGGVHPVHLDKASSDHAAQIEQLPSMEALPNLMTEIFRNYCRLVRTHAMQTYSPPVQKALVYIDANLSENISLRTLADTLNVSPGYLSTLFHKETGQKLTDYINQRRILHAKHLLKTTRLQIQTVAQHCGIMDVHYFSKVFKRHTGQTPKQYRDSRQ